MSYNVDCIETCGLCLESNTTGIYLKIVSDSTLTEERELKIKTGDSARTIDINDIVETLLNKTTVQGLQQGLQIDRGNIQCTYNNANSLMASVSFNFTFDSTPEVFVSKTNNKNVSSAIYLRSIPDDNNDIDEEGFTARCVDPSGGYVADDYIYLRWIAIG